MSFPPPTPNQARIIWLALTGLAVALLIALVVAVTWGLGRVINLLGPVLWPIAVAGVLAYILDPVVDFLQRKGVKRTPAILCVFALALLIVATMVSSVLPQVIREIGQFSEKVPTLTARLEQRVEAWVSQPPVLLRRLLNLETPAPADTNVLSETNPATTATPAIANAPDSIATATTTNSPGSTATATNAPSSLLTKALDRDTIHSAAAWVSKVLPHVGSWLFGQAVKVAAWFGVLAGLALIPVYTFYFLLEKKGISSRWTNYLPVSDSRFKDELVFVLSSINDYLIVFFRGQVLVAICDGVMYAIGFSIVGVPYALLLGAAAIGLTIIPFLGAIATCTAALLLALVQHGDWQHPVLVLVVFGIVQTIEGYVIQPKIIGDRVGLHPVTIIIALMVGTALLGGILGGILAIPLTAALRVVMFRYVWKKREEEPALAVEEVRRN